MLLIYYGAVKNDMASFVVLWCVYFFNHGLSRWNQFRNKALAGCVGFGSSVFEERGYSEEASIQIGQDGIVLGGLVPVHAGQHHQWDHAV